MNYNEPGSRLGNYSLSLPLSFHTHLQYIVGICHAFHLPHMQQDKWKAPLHRFPPKSEPVKCKQWLTALGLSESDIADHHRICSQHVPNGDSSQIPSLHLGKRFRSPKKVWTARAQRAAKRSRDAKVPTATRNLQCSQSPAPTRVY